MAKTERYTVARVIDALRSTRGMKGPAARRLGCAWTTVDGYAKRHATVQQAIDEEREMMLDVGELSLARAVQNGEAWAVCFLLKTQGKSRGYVEKTQVDVLLRQELEGVVGALEDALEPDEFRKVASVLARSAP